MSEEVTRSHLEELQRTIREQFIDTYKNNKDALRKIKSTTKLQDSDPLIELGKLSQLIRSYITKIGIITKPDAFKEANFRATFKELKGFTDITFYLFSLLPVFYKDEKNAEFLLNRIDYAVFELLNGMEVLCDELNRKFDDLKSDKDRLLSVGMIWASCDVFDTISKKGNFGLLVDNVRGSNGLIDDVLSDIDEFLEDPSFEMEGLTLEDDFESDNDEERDENELESGEKEVLGHVINFVEEWKNNVKLIRLLLSSFVSSISSTTYKSTDYSGSMLDELQSLHLAITAELDDLIADVFMSGSSFDRDEMKEQIEILDGSLNKLVAVIKKLNKGDSKKSKWIDVWATKYFEKK